MKTFLSKHTLHKILSLIKLDLSHKVDSRDQLTEDDVRLIWNEVTGKDIPNILSLQHNHDDLYSKLDHNHDTVYSKLNHNHVHNHDERYYTEAEVNNLLNNQKNILTNDITSVRNIANNALPRSNVTDNRIVTDLSYTLSAKENNPNVENSLRWNVNRIWNNLGNPISPSVSWNGDVINTTSYSDVIQFYIIRNLCFFHRIIHCNKSYTKKQYYRIGTLNNYRPYTDITISMRSLQTNAWGDVIFNTIIRQNGEISFSPSSDCHDMTMDLTGLWRY